ncbi:MAG: glycosyltransferase [Planctomycetota bacterium]
MIDTPQLSLAIPCYNEEDCVGDTVPPLVEAFHQDGVDLELVLVNNGSTDRTGEIIDEMIASGLPIVKVDIPRNQGYSNGIMRGLEQCRAPVIGFCHADGQVSPQDVVRTYRLIENREERVLTKVRRRYRQDSWKRKIVSIIYNGMMQIVFGWLGSIDINGSPKIFSRRNFQAMELRSRDWFLDPEIILKAKGLGMRTIEIDVEGHARHGGASHVRPATMMEFLLNIWRYRTSGHLRRWRKAQYVKKPIPPKPDPLAAAQTSKPAGLSAVRVLPQKRFEDERGFLHKVLTSSQAGSSRWNGEVYVTAAHPGEAKGNHFHRRMGEWFTVVLGTGSLELRDPDSGEQRSIPLEADSPCVAYVPSGVAHAVVNRGNELLVCVAWAEAEHDPSDVFAHPVWPRDTAQARA